MRLWFQLISSGTHMKDFIASTQARCDRAATPGTVVEVHGTNSGTLGQDYNFFK